MAETREHWARQASLGRDMHIAPTGARLEDLFKQIQAGEAATLNLIVKADVTGSLEALTESLRKLERDEVKLSFVLRGVGPHHRGRHPAGGRGQRHDHRLQRASRPQGPGARRP